MPTTSPATSRLLPAAALCALCAAVFAWLLLRNHGLGPAIFADEWYYSKFSRLQPLGEAILPSYLYLWLFRATNACGDGFLDCVRIGNELLFVAAAPFIYAVTRRVAAPAPALAVTALALLAPVNLFTSFFMPESTYYFGFALLSWVLLGWRAVPRRRPFLVRALAAGVVLGLMSLVKVHALFLLPALCLYLPGAAWLQARPRWLRDGAVAALLAAACMLAVKFGVGWLLAGDAGLSLFGPFYAGTVASHGHHPLAQLLASVSTSAAAHLMTLAVLFALPLAMLVLAVFSPRARAQRDPSALHLMLFALLALGAAVGMTVMFTASVADANPAEGFRVHLRYYSFVFPLLLAVAAAALTPARASAGADAKRAPGWAARLAVAVPLAILLACAAWKLPGYVLNTVDGPEITAIGLGQPAGWVAIGLGLLVLALWAGGSRLAAPLFLFAAVPWMALQGAAANAAYLAGIDPHWQPDVAGKFAHRYVPASEHNQITVAGNDVMKDMRAQFYIDAPDSGTLALPPDAPLVPHNLPIRNKWLLVIGHHPLPPGVRPTVASADYALVRMDTRRRVIGTTRFGQPLGGGLVARAEGLSHLETWGRWSEAKRVVLHFSQPLPVHANVVIKAQAFGPNIGAAFTMRIGNEVQTFRVSDVPEDVTLRFTTDGAQRSLAIDIPKPTAPHDVSPSIDTRLLGLGLSDIEISTPPDA